MKHSDALDMRGRLSLHAFDRAGNPIGTTKANNSIVYTGRDLVAQLFLDEELKPVRYIAVGTGSKKVEPDIDTQLQNEIFRKKLKKVDLTKDLMDINIETQKDPYTSRKIILSADLDFEEPATQPNGDPHKLTEAGLFNAKSGGIMYNRVIFPSISKTKDFKLTLVWEIIF
ncbi:MAG: hypothetical protein ABG776_09500 [Cyanobacteria bacterium J06555_13]